MKLVCIGDLHINSKHLKFEETKLTTIIQELNKLSYDRLVLAGDIFDKNSPNLKEIQLFYKFLELTNCKDVIVIDGNHDYTTFDYLPSLSSFKYTKDEILDGVHYVSWSKIKDFNSRQAKILISHIRGNVGKYIKEEANLSSISSNYKLTVLGDIHSPITLDNNVIYTSSPAPTHHKLVRENEHGFVVVDTETLTVDRVFLDKPLRIKVELNVAEAIEYVKSIEEYNTYKIIVRDSNEELYKLREINLPNVSIEPIPTVGEYTDSVDLDITTNMLDKVLEYTHSKFNDSKVLSEVRSLLGDT